MELLTPKLGLTFWNLIIFLILFFLLRKFAWKPILNSVKKREEFISESLKKAENAQIEMQKLTSSNEELIKQTYIEREKILKEAKDAKTEIIQEAKEIANKESIKLIEKAKLEIEALKKASIEELKNQVAILSIDIASNVLKKKFENEGEQKKLLEDLLKEINFK